MSANTTDLLKKLAPLIPRDVAQWRASLPLVDAATRQLLEQHIDATARRLLGVDHESGLLLPPPPATKAAGPLRLGMVQYPTRSHAFGVAQRELLQGLGIYGRSGSGKTNICFTLLQALSHRRIPFLFLDWKRTARHLLPELSRRVNVYTPGRELASFIFNPLIPAPGVELRSHTLLVVDSMAAAFTLGDGAKALLQKVLTGLYEQRDEKAWPTITELEQALEAQAVTGRATGWKATALRALQSLAFSLPAPVTAASQEELVRSLLKQASVIELDALGDNVKRFLVPLLLQWLFRYRLQAQDREKLKLVVFVEEAHQLLYRSESRTRESVMNQLLRQGRELGIGFVIVDQHPHLISSAALGNVYTSICLNLKEPSDLNRAAALSGLSSDEKPLLLRLPVGSGVVKLQDRWREPFVVAFDHARVAKGAVTDETLRELLRRGCRNTSRSCVTKPGRAGIPGVRRVRTAASLSQDALRLVKDCAEHPADGVKARYQRLGYSMENGGQLKNQLVRAGWLEAELIRVGRTRVLALAPTRDARWRLKLGTGTPVGGISHEFWKQRWAKALRDAGWTVQLEAPRVGGRVDIEAEKEGFRLAVEVETGKSDMRKNIENCLEEGYDQVLVVPTNEKVRKRAEEILGSCPESSTARPITFDDRALAHAHA